MPSIDLAEAARLGESLRAAAGIRSGSMMTDEQCRHVRALVDDELEARGFEPAGRAWYTAQTIAGRICGIWAHGELEAVLELMTRGELELAWIVEDPRLEIRDEYYPFGRRATDPESFPVTPAPATRAELAMLSTPVSYTHLTLPTN